jgi:putative endonuclease
LGVSTRDLFNRFIAVYIMSNRKHGTLYVGVTSQLPTRINEHREGLIPGFTQKYGLKRLVWFEPHETMAHAIHREKMLKKYKRDWKINLIELDNPLWEDLYPALIGDIGVYGWPGQARP